MSSQPPFSLENHCEPCQAMSSTMASARASASPVVTRMAQTVSPLPPYSANVSRMNSTLQHINAINLGATSSQHGSGSFTGYTAGVARY